MGDCGQPCQLPQSPTPQLSFTSYEHYLTTYFHLPYAFLQAIHGLFASLSFTQRETAGKVW